MDVTGTEPVTPCLQNSQARFDAEHDARMGTPTTGGRIAWPSPRRANR